MRKLIKKHLIAHKDNDHQPHILRDTGIVLISYVAVIAFLLIFVQARVLSVSSFLASILPNVLTDLANENRVEISLNSLEINPVLVEAAQLKANDMAEKGYFAHTSPEGVEPWDWFTKAGYSYLYAGENLAVDFSDSSAVDDAWMASPGHRSNILNGNFTEIGIATAEGELEGRKTTFVVQMFGRPRALAIVPPSDAEIVEFEETQEAAVVEENEPRVLEESETFVAVEAEPATSVSDPGAVREKESSAIAKVASSPSKTLEYLYIFISALLLIAIFSVVVKQFKAHHVKQVIAGGALMGLMALLFFVAHGLLFLEVRVI